MKNPLGRRLACLVVCGLLLALTLPAAGLAKGNAESVAVSGVTPAYVPYYEDSFEPDDTTATATLYDPAVHGNTWMSYHTFHGDDSADNESGESTDTVRVSVDVTGTPIWVETEYATGFYDTYIYIEDATGTTLAKNDDHYFWSATYSNSVYYEAPAPGDYYVRVRNLSGYPYDYYLYITVGNARRISGATRFDTAAEISRTMWDNIGNSYYGVGYGPEDIFIANGFNPADALAGAQLAAQSDGILLLTHGDVLTPATKAEIERVTESLYWDFGSNSISVNVHVLGGEGVISQAVMDGIGAIRHVTHVDRIAGADRFATAAQIASVTADWGYAGTTAFVVNGFAWPDALAVGPVAANHGSAVFMTRKDDVPDVTMDMMDDLGITDVVVVGGSGVVGPAAIAELESKFGTASVEVVAGNTRYDTAQAIAQWGVDNAGMSGDICTLASGADFPDALAAAPISWWTAGPLLLTMSTALSPQVKDFFDDNGGVGRPNTTSGSQTGMGCYVVGGTGAISEDAYNEFRDLYKEYLP